MPFRTRDAVYSAALDRIVVVADRPARLYVLDPESLSREELDLPLTPNAVAIDSDGRTAAVGHDGSVSLVQLDPLELSQTIACDLNVANVMFGADGYVYANSNFGTDGRIHAVHIESGADVTPEKQGGGISSPHLHPAGDRIYGVSNLSPPDLVRFDVEDGAVSLAYDSPYHGDYEFGSNLWFTQDGTRILTSFGDAFGSSNVRAEDMRYMGGLDGNVRVRALDHSSKAKLIATVNYAVVDEPGSAPAPQANEIALFDEGTLNHRQTVALPALEIASERYAAAGDFVFFRADGSRLYALSHYPATESFDALARYDVDGNSAGDPISGTESQSAPIPPAKTSQGIVLDFAVVDAEYSRALDRIVAVQADPDKLLLLEAASGSFESVALPRTPTAISLHPSGKLAAVGHNGAVSVVDLEQRVVMSTQPVSAVISDVVLANNGYVYAFPARDQWEYIRSLQLASGSETLSGGSIFEGTVARLHPRGDRMYGATRRLAPSKIERYEIASGTAQVAYGSPYHGDYEMCGNLWFSEDGTRIFTACGNVFQASNVERSDLRYELTLAGSPVIAHLDHSAAAGLVAVARDMGRSLPSGAPSRSALAHGEVLLFDDDSFTKPRKLVVPDVTIEKKAYASAPRFVFFNANGSELYVVAEPEGQPRTLLLAISPSDVEP